MFKTAGRVFRAAACMVGVCEPLPLKVGPVVVLPGWHDGRMVWAPVYWVALGPVVVCYRPAPSARGVRVFWRQVDAAVSYGGVV